MAKIDKRLEDLLKSYGEDGSAVWNCHGTWVAYHAAIERMAAKAKITFSPPEMIWNDPQAKNICVMVSAQMGDKSEWSFGEVSSKNCKNEYPYAMAEKRAKDRVALKLLGMAGLAYSEEEADDFKDSKPAPEETPEAPAKSSAQLKRDGEWERVSKEIADAMNDIATFGQFEELKASYRKEAGQRGWNKAFLAALKDLFDGYEDQVRKTIEAENAGDVVQDIVRNMGGTVRDERVISTLQAG